MALKFQNPYQITAETDLNSLEGKEILQQALDMLYGQIAKQEIAVSDRFGSTVTQLSSQIDEIVTPAGAVIFTAGGTPAGWLRCNGQTLLRADYPELFASIGTRYGSTASSNFKVPDIRSRMVIGDGQGSGLTDRSRGDTGGSETHALSTAELAQHNHTLSGDSHSHGVTDSGHTHTVTDSGHSHTGLTDPGAVNVPAGTFSQVPTIGGSGVPASSTTGLTVDSGTTGISVNSNSTGGTISNTGSGTAHENMSPFIALRAIIKT